MGIVKIPTFHMRKLRHRGAKQRAQGSKQTETPNPDSTLGPRADATQTLPSLSRPSLSPILGMDTSVVEHRQSRHAPVHKDFQCSQDGCGFQHHSHVSECADAQILDSSGEEGRPWQQGALVGLARGSAIRTVQPPGLPAAPSSIPRVEDFLAPQTTPCPEPS